MKIYVASSWRNPIQPHVITALCLAGHDVYDFRHPSLDDNGFQWSWIDPGWQGWSPERFRDCLNHEIAVKGFEIDWAAMQWADACVLVLPCGRSAHLEAGYFVGAGKPLIILLSDGEPELMYRMADYICVNLDEVVTALRAVLIKANPLAGDDRDPQNDRRQEA